MRLRTMFRTRGERRKAIVRCSSGKGCPGWAPKGLLGPMRPVYASKAASTAATWTLLNKHKTKAPDRLEYYVLSCPWKQMGEFFLGRAPVHTYGTVPLKNEGCFEVDVLEFLSPVATPIGTWMKLRTHLLRPSLTCKTLISLFPIWIFYLKLLVTPSYHLWHRNLPIFFTCPLQNNNKELHTAYTYCPFKIELVESVINFVFESS